MKTSRRTFLKSTLLGSLWGYIQLVHAKVGKLEPTPSEIEGPFYPITPQRDKDSDLTRIVGRNGTAQGEVVWIEVHVLDTTGATIPDVQVEIWQANSAGRYRHPRDANKAPLDPNFQGWAIVASDDAGKLKFKTVKPGAYPAADGWSRPPHIHFKASKQGYSALTTQMYFPNEPLNELDLLIRRKSKEALGQMTAISMDGDAKFAYTIVLQKG